MGSGRLKQAVAVFLGEAGNPSTPIAITAFSHAQKPESGAWGAGLGSFGFSLTDPVNMIPKRSPESNCCESELDMDLSLGPREVYPGYFDLSSYCGR